MGDLTVSYSLAVDIGGTFTDAVLRGSDGSLVVDKTLTTHHDLLEGFFRSVDLTLAKAGIGPERIDGVVVHATTVVTNALIERKGRPTALITTKGFRDVLPIRNEHRYEMYDPQIEFAEPLTTWTEHTITDPAAVRTHVDEVRRQGWATAVDAVQIGVNALAAPVFDHRGDLRGAVALVGATQSIPQFPSAELTSAVTAAAAEASRRLGWGI